LAVGWLLPIQPPQTSVAGAAVKANRPGFRIPIAIPQPRHPSGIDAETFHHLMQPHGLTFNAAIHRPAHLVTSLLDEKSGNPDDLDQAQGARQRSLDVHYPGSHRP